MPGRFGSVALAFDLWQNVRSAAQLANEESGWNEPANCGTGVSPAIREWQARRLLHKKRQNLLFAHSS